jgi:hypothetical protein
MIVGIDPSLTSSGLSDGTRTVLLTTQPKDELAAPLDILRRVDEQMVAIEEFLEDGGVWREHVTFYIEDVKKSITTMQTEGNTRATVGVSHLYEMGYWFAIFYTTFSDPLRFTIHLVNPGQLKAYVGGKANYPKAKMALASWKKWEIEFDGDPGLDKLHAYCLVRYGQEHIAGTIEHEDPSRRGLGDKARAITKRRTNSRVTETL